MNEGVALGQKKIQIASDLSLPVDLCTESIAILAIKGAGKSTLARRIVEGISDANQQCVVVDPKGDWFGLLYGSDGKSPGLPFVVIGGEHGHIPLPSGAGHHAIEKNGELIARLAVVERVSMVLDLSGYRKHELARFMTIFMETLYRMKAKDEYRTPMMLAIDEADAIVPQRAVKSEGGMEPRMLGAAEDIVRRGRQRGIGTLLISQRGAVLNKNVLTQCPLLFALRTSGTQDIDAIKDWLDANFAQEPPEIRRQIAGVLPQFVNGEGWVLSSSFPMPPGVRVRTRFLMPRTFDSSATPKAGQQRVVPKNAADVDIEAFQRELAETIEESKADDPSELRKQILSLKKELAIAQQEKPAAATDRRIEVSVLTDADRKLIEGLASLAILFKGDLGSMQEACSELKSMCDRIQASFNKTAASSHERPVSLHKMAHSSHQKPTSAHKTAPVMHKTHSAEHVGPLQRQILTVLSHYPNGRSKRQLGVHTGKSHKGGYFGNVLGAMKTAGWIDGSPELYRITDAGRETLGPVDDMPRGKALLEFWAPELNTTEYGIVSTLYECYPGTLTKGELGQVLGKEAGGGYFGNCLGRVRTLELVSGRNNALQASELFFEEPA